MTTPRRKPRHCRQCGKPLRTSKTGRWFFCPPPESRDDGPPCQEAYIATHEPDGDPGHLLDMLPTDEDDEGKAVSPTFQPEEFIE